ncbi:hypothetical protein KVR01_003554 [Diaporthe batatas]|uniref:uncharacterized protein n=1 Tax=Diaporthe batatas TaxID=748121 RepID=UPI001D0478DA|nr:uncharacterized protein KVR01_003554 [Diaporthe batatas]KAG8167865.1 hypothetical protein KVR01_003554 [Diaporthe batatas]
MKITKIYVYPIKSLQGIALQKANLDRQGVQHDRRFMLLRVHRDGNHWHEPVEVVRYPACALFIPEIRDGNIVVRYQLPDSAPAPTPAQETTLEIPLEPDTSGLEKIEVDLYKSKTMGYRMPEAHNSWFSSWLGFEAILVYVGDGKRQVLGTMSPHAQNKQNQGWLSSMKSYIGSSEDPHWLTFTCVAPYLVATETSLNDVSSRLPPGEEMDIRKFRPNIVVEGEGPFDEDYWGELEVENGVRLSLTGNCGRCVSINVDYTTGKPGTGESGKVLKKLMKDRRVDKGNKYSPVFGRYGFLQAERAEIQVGGDVVVTKRLEERCVWDWPPYN